MNRQETTKQRNARLDAFDRGLLPVRSADRADWKLNRVDDIEWIQDQSGIQTIINWDLQTESVRLDIMAEASLAEPLQSFIGRADNVRKAVTRWLDKHYGTGDGYDRESGILLEHAAYIGAELERCDTERIDYIQS